MSPIATVVEKVHKNLLNNGRSPPTSPALRLGVLTPPNHYAHRGGRRGHRLFTTRRKLQSAGAIVLRNTDGGASFHIFLCVRDLIVPSSPLTRFRTRTRSIGR